MDKLISPVVITSRAAEQDIAKMQAAHADILDGMRQQAIKVQQYNQDKQARVAQQTALESEQKKQQKAEQQTYEQSQRDFLLKQKEMELKAEKLKALNG